MAEKELVFESDEMQLKEMDPEWTPEDLLGKTGIFFLKDVVKKLKVPAPTVKKRANELIASGKDAWKIMGVRKQWTHWIVRMKVFAPYYREHFYSDIKSIDPSWDGNDLIMQTGKFRLKDVCDKIPFTTHQLRYQARSKGVPGLYQKGQSWYVKMEEFAPWLRKAWGGDYS